MYSLYYISTWSLTLNEIQTSVLFSILLIHNCLNNCKIWSTLGICKKRLENRTVSGYSKFSVYRYLKSQLLDVCLWLTKKKYILHVINKKTAAVSSSYTYIIRVNGFMHNVLQVVYKKQNYLFGKECIHDMSTVISVH